MLDIPHEAKVSIFACTHTHTHGHEADVPLSLSGARSLNAAWPEQEVQLANSPENSTIFAGFLPPSSLSISPLATGCCTSDWNPLLGAALFIRLTFK